MRSKLEIAEIWDTVWGNVLGKILKSIQGVEKTPKPIWKRDYA